jgi:hypothetical protein
MVHDPDAAIRARARRHWPVRVVRQDDESCQGDLVAATAAERLAMMWPLAREAFALAGIPTEPRPRSDLRAVLRRLDEPPDRAPHE